VPEIYEKSDYRQPVESDLLTFTNSILVNSMFFQENCWSMNLVAVIPTQIEERRRKFYLTYTYTCISLYINTYKTFCHGWYSNERE
jgi:hypothetical protein